MSTFRSLKSSRICVERSPTEVTHRLAAEAAERAAARKEAAAATKAKAAGSGSLKNSIRIGMLEGLRARSADATWEKYFITLFAVEVGAFAN
eukprot:jgi/Tetstr1/427877/TSEL_017953.t1